MPRLLRLARTGLLSATAFAAFLAALGAARNAAGPTASPSARRPRWPMTTTGGMTMTIEAPRR